MTNRRQIIGKWGEQKAKEYLFEQGYSLIAENWRFRYGEIDLIMLEGNSLIFVEVRTKTNANYGFGYESINQRKQQKLVISAKAFLQSRNWQNRAIRFDMISIDKIDNRFKLKHIKNIIN